MPITDPLDSDYFRRIMAVKARPSKLRQTKLDFGSEAPSSRASVHSSTSHSVGRIASKHNPLHNTSRHAQTTSSGPSSRSQYQVEKLGKEEQRARDDHRSRGPSAQGRHILSSTSTSIGTHNASSPTPSISQSRHPAHRSIAGPPVRAYEDEDMYDDEDARDTQALTRDIDEERYVLTPVRNVPREGVRIPYPADRNDLAHNIHLPGPSTHIRAVHSHPKQSTDYHALERGYVSPDAYHKYQQTGRTFLEENPGEAQYRDRHEESVKSVKKRDGDDVGTKSNKRSKSEYSQRYAMNKNDNKYPGTLARARDQYRPGTPAPGPGARDHHDPLHASRGGAKQPDLAREPPAHPQPTINKAAKPYDAQPDSTVDTSPASPSKHRSPVSDRVKSESPTVDYSTFVIAKPVRKDTATQSFEQLRDTPVTIPVADRRARSKPQPFPMLKFASTTGSECEAAMSVSSRPDATPEDGGSLLQAQIEDTLRGVELLADDNWDELSDTSDSDMETRYKYGHAKITNDERYVNLEDSNPDEEHDQDPDEDLDWYLDGFDALVIEESDEEEPETKTVASRPSSTTPRLASKLPRWAVGPPPDGADEARSFFGDAFDQNSRTLRIGFESGLVDLDMKIENLCDTKQRFTRFTHAVETLILEDLPDLPTVINLAYHCEGHRSTHIFPNVKHLVFAGSAQSRFVQVVIIHTQRQVDTYLKAFAKLCSPQSLCSDYAFGALYNERIKNALKILRDHWPALQRCTIHKALDDLPWTMPGIDHRVIYHPWSCPFNSIFVDPITNWFLKVKSYKMVKSKPVLKRVDNGEFDLALENGLREDEETRTSWTLDVPPIPYLDKPSFATSLRELINRLPMVRGMIGTGYAQGDAARSKEAFTLRVRKNDHAECGDCGWTPEDVCRLKTGDQW